MEQLYLIGVAACAVAGLLVNWKLEQAGHNKRLRRRKLRIHVNGIRGKSTVTRIVAGVLRGAGMHVVAKTTGSAACLIDRYGKDHSIRRAGSPTILEQVEFIKNLDKDVEALVVECMAIKPEYQRICEDKIVQSNIGVITNVREDHQDILGESLDEIAGNLLSTCPRNGFLITAETNPLLLPVFRQVAERNQTELIVVDPDDVTDEELARFPYVSFKENVAIGFAVARLSNINRDIALQGMIQADPDPGVLRIEKKRHRNGRLIWADLFAVNDRESVILCVDKVSKLAPKKACRIGILNNRQDREHRAVQFARIAANDLQFDYLVLMGAYEQRVESELVANGYSRQRIIGMDQSSEDGEKIIELILEKAGLAFEGPENSALIVGLVNIHTPQADGLRKWFMNGENGGDHEQR